MNRTYTYSEKNMTIVLVIGKLIVPQVNMTFFRLIRLY